MPTTGELAEQNIKARLPGCSQERAIGHKRLHDDPYESSRHALWPAPVST